jgi:hypothetical protein
MTARDEGLTLCPGGCGCRLGTEDADARECGCEDGCCDGQDWFEVGDADAGTILVAWTEGERCRIVEHYDSTRQPVENGEVIPATVTSVAGLYVSALPNEAGRVRKPVTFWAGSGWTAWDGMFRWRLIRDGEAAVVAGEGNR